MSNVLPDSAAPAELHPHLLYRQAGGQAEFATWRLESGQEALAIFTTAESASQYQAELAAAAPYTLFQPPRDKLLAIFKGSLAAGIRVAALDPLAGGAKSLFDLAQVIASANRQAAD